MQFRLTSCGPELLFFCIFAREKLYMMIETAVLLTFVVSATAHFVLCAVVSLFAYHRVEYLPLAWISGICATVLGVVAFFAPSVADGHPDALHPAMAWMLLIGIFLQSFYTFGFSMPGFLQLGRMLRYASPIIVLGAVYLLFPNAWWLKGLTLLVGVGYIVNIYAVPLRYAKRTRVPAYLKSYTAALVLTYAFYVYIALNYNPLLLCGFVFCVTSLNGYLAFRAFDSLMKHLPRPGVSDELTSREVVGAADADNGDDDEDFNEKNLERYLAVERWMAGNRQHWMDFTFNRECLCREVGLNRQLLLQCLRSQGHNNIHDYLMLYRVKELRRLIERGEITQMSECVDAGFGAVKTARSCFGKIEGVDLDEFLKSHRR